MLKSIVASWKKYRSTISFYCWLKSKGGQVSFAKVKAVPTEDGYDVTSYYSKGGNKPIVQKVFMSKEKFFDFYRTFA